MMPKNVSSRVISTSITQALTGLSRSVNRLLEKPSAIESAFSRSTMGLSLARIQGPLNLVSQPVISSGVMEMKTPVATSLSVTPPISKEGRLPLSERAFRENSESTERKLTFILEFNKCLLRLRSLVSGLNLRGLKFSQTSFLPEKSTHSPKAQAVAITTKGSLAAPDWLSPLLGKLERVATFLGKSSAPYLLAVANSITLVSERIKTWAAANPAIVQSVSAFIAGLATVTKMITGVKEFVEKLTAPFVALMDLIDVVRKRWTLLKTAFSSGGNLHLITRGLRQLGKGLKAIVRGMGTVGRFAGKLGLALGGTISRGITLVGRAVVFLGRALLMNPIGLIITGIATAAYLIYRYWTPISAFFKRLWSQVTQTFSGTWSRIKNTWGSVSSWFGKTWGQIKSAFSGGIMNIGLLILRWSPLNLFIKAFSAVMSWFGVDIPKKFSDFGGQLITGLVKGVTQKLAAAKESIVNFGNSVSGWFKSALGINSPSRIFIGFGDNIAQGAAIGIDRTTPHAAKASQNMAKKLIPDIPAGQAIASVSVSHSIHKRINPIKPNGQDSAPAIPAIPAAPSRKIDRSTSAAAGGIHVNFSPNITMNSKSPTAAGELSGALKLSLRELEKMLEKIANQQNRRGYA